MDPSHDTYLVRLARSGREHLVFATIPRLAEADPRVMCLACEHLQVNLFNEDFNGASKKWWSVHRERKLNYFRLAQKIRDEHGTARNTPLLNCFKSFGDIVKLERDIELDDCAEFMKQCMRLNSVDNKHIRKMFESTSTVEQLADLYDECVLMLERCSKEPRTEVNFDQYGLGSIFKAQFKNLMRTRQCERPLWRDTKMYLERAIHLTSSDWPTSDLDIPDADLDEAVSCLLANAELFNSADLAAELVRYLKTLLSRGASLYHRDQHGVSSLRRLLSLRIPYVRQLRLPILSRYICCPLKNESGKIIADNRRPAPLTCLAARRVPPSTIEEHIDSKLRPFVGSHQELPGVLAGNIQDPEPVDKWRRPYRDF